MQIQNNIELAPYTTFKIGGPAGYFCVAENQEDALKAFDFAKKNNLKTFVLGGGSNVLISDEGFDGLVINVANSGIEVINNNDNDVYLKVASGEIWDKVVNFAVTENFWGIENLSHIPGRTGAIAVQNVGAYGQEAGKVIDSVEVFDKDTGQALVLKNEDCGFAYRKSIFNSEKKGSYIIFDIIFRLRRNGLPELSYRDLKNKFAGKNPGLRDIRQAITEIRDKKFPFPTKAKNGNAGSFFKNPVLSGSQFAELKNKLQKEFGVEMAEELEKKKFIDTGPSAFASGFIKVASDKKTAAAGKLLNNSESVKVPAAFLIDICGLKGIKSGGAAINESQPLVIINQTGSATAQDVINLANKVLSTVKAKTGIWLKIEPELIGFKPEVIKTML